MMTATDYLMYLGKAAKKLKARRELLEELRVAEKIYSDIDKKTPRVKKIGEKIEKIRLKLA